MAEEPKITGNKRRVRNPETFRERAIKASESSDKQAKKQRLRKAGALFARPITRPASQLASNSLFQKQPFKLLGIIRRFIGKILIPVYIRNSWRELRLVTWPTWNESRRLTVAVLMFAVVFGAVVAGLDYGLDKIFRNVLLK